jgi:hypothetical protein
MVRKSMMGSSPHRSMAVKHSCPAVRVSRESSLLHPAGNFVLPPTIDSSRVAGSDGNLEMAFIVTADRFPDQGDYMGLAADAGGAFHPFWSDNRSGSSQASTATVTVGPVTNATASNAGDRTPSTVSITSKVQLVLDPTSFDATTGVEEIPVRLRNVSDMALCRPIRVELSELQGMQGTPQILNASNGKAGNGAEFDYSHALGDFSCLDPGAVSEEIVCRIKLADPSKTYLLMGFTVSGSERSVKAVDNK